MNLPPEGVSTGQNMTCKDSLPACPILMSGMALERVQWTEYIEGKNDGHQSREDTQEATG
jgi:hypothetical protein